MLRENPIVPGEIYHIYNRGTDKRLIFLDSNDYTRFTYLLFLSNSTKHFKVRDILDSQRHTGPSCVWDFDRGELLVDIGAWVLMPNHFHIMLKERIPGGTTLFMRKLSTGYSMYFNKKNERTGALFEGRFKSRHVGDEGYVRWLFAYIHLNALKLFDPHWKQGIRDIFRARAFMEGFTWGSYQDWFMNTQDRPVGIGKILEQGSFPEDFKKLNTFEDILKEFTEGLFEHSVEPATISS